MSLTKSFLMTIDPINIILSSCLFTKVQYPRPLEKTQGKTTGNYLHLDEAPFITRGIIKFSVVLTSIKGGAAPSSLFFQRIWER